MPSQAAFRFSYCPRIIGRATMLSLFSTEIAPGWLTPPRLALRSFNDGVAFNFNRRAQRVLLYNAPETKTVSY